VSFFRLSLLENHDVLSKSAPATGMAAERGLPLAKGERWLTNDELYDY